LFYWQCGFVKDNLFEPMVFLAQGKVEKKTKVQQKFDIHAETRKTFV
jgi:hypothetical protein